MATEPSSGRTATGVEDSTQPSTSSTSGRGGRTSSAGMPSNGSASATATRPPGLEHARAATPASAPGASSLPISWATCIGKIASGWRVSRSSSRASAASAVTGSERARGALGAGGDQVGLDVHGHDLVPAGRQVQGHTAGAGAHVEHRAAALGGQLAPQRQVGRVGRALHVVPGGRRSAAPGLRDLAPVQVHRPGSRGSRWCARTRAGRPCRARGSRRAPSRGSPGRPRRCPRPARGPGGPRPARPAQVGPDPARHVRDQAGHVDALVVELAPVQRLQPLGVHRQRQARHRHAVGHLQVEEGHVHLGPRAVLAAEVASCSPGSPGGCRGPRPGTGGSRSAGLHGAVAGAVGHQRGVAEHPFGLAQSAHLPASPRSASSSRRSSSAV